MRSHVAGSVPTSHFENHLRSDVSGAISLITEPELKTTKRDLKMSPESESNIHNDGDNIFIFSSHWRKFQLKMGLLTIIQIPCHVLANEIPNRS